MPRLINPPQFEEGLSGLTPPRSMILLDEIRQTILIPAASRNAPGDDTAGRGKFARCDNRGVVLVNPQEKLTLVDEISFALYNENPYQGFVQAPQIDAFSFVFTFGPTYNDAVWMFNLGPTVLEPMNPGVNYFFPVRAKQLLFAMATFPGGTIDCYLKTFRYI